MLEGIAATILDTAAKGATKILVDSLKRANEKHHDLATKEHSAKLVGPTRIVQDALVRHLKDIERWSSTILLSDSKSRKLVSSIYVALDAYLMPLSTHETRAERDDTTALLPALQNCPSHCVILGHPGAGKTTSLQKICIDYFKKGRALLNYNFPILVRLREISASTSKSPIYDKLCEILSLDFHFTPPVSRAVDNESDREIRASVIRETVAAYLETLSCLIILDGFDEISSDTTRVNAERDLELLAAQLSASRLVVSCRSSDFRYKLNDIAKFELAPLTLVQIKMFAANWLGDAGAAEDFTNKVFSSPFADTAIRPLTVAHLCAIYERIKNVPDKPKSVYRRIVHLLLEEWDSQRQVRRNSAYAGFDADRKLEFLAHFSFELTCSGATLFDRETLKQIYANIHGYHGLPANHAAKVAREIESHSGLIVQGQYGEYEFAHKSLQEFLTADYLVRLPDISMAARHIGGLANEFAIAVALSSRPAAFLKELILRHVVGREHFADWYKIFMTRLSLEKPDLRSRPSPDESFAALALLANSDASSDCFQLLRTMLPANPEPLLLEYYARDIRREETAQEEMVFRRVRLHQIYNLPAHMKFPKGLSIWGKA